MVHHGIQKTQHAVVVTIEIEETNRFVVIAQLAPGPDLIKLFKGPYAAGQSNECIGFFGHHLLAFVHGFYNVQLCTFCAGPFLFNQSPRNDADDASTSQHGGLSNCAHQTVSTPPINQLAAVLTNPSADLPG